MLSPNPWHFIALLLLGLGLLLRGAAAAELTAGKPQAGLLLLTNGSILEGEISSFGSYYKVVLPHGDLQIRRDQVDCFCLDLKEVYQKLHTRRVDNSLVSYLELARWCIQHDLFAEAGRELDDAESFAPKSTLVNQVRAQLEQSRTLAQADVAPAVQLHQVVQADYVEPTRPEPIDSPVAELPSWARSEFVKRVQPLFLHSCATGGCHSPSKADGWTLNRGAVDGVGSPELIEQNLLSVLEYVDRDDTGQSEILQRGMSPHGSEARPSEKLRPRQIAILEAWLEQLALEQTDQNDARTNATAVAREDSKQFDATPQRNTARRAPQEKDPFDPTEFNRRYHSDSSDEVTPLPDNPSDSAVEAAKSPPGSVP